MSKNTWLLAGICGITALGALVYLVEGNVAETREVTVIPGTGVSMALPDGVVIAPLGTIFIDSRHEVMVGLVEGPASKGSMNKYAFPGAGESFRSSTISGVLYKRTRSEGKGTWDGWQLNASRGDTSLDLLLSYSGSKPGKFEELKKYLSTVSWNDQIRDPEVAFGLRLHVSGLRLVPSVVGALAYTQDGKPSQNAPYMNVFAGPYSLKGDMLKFHQLCEKDASVIANGEHVSVRYQSRNQMWVCDAWGQSYTAVLMLPDGSIANVLGQGDPDVFQSALLNAQVIPRVPSKK
ncbi:hypothetical protein [Dyella caseinilytica]|uniref:Uncharacterized protein n=1 Tax=Dyella caseinilytica TaxID=1849581 RepID=A0ABX7GTX7_9GAMM|nr:hypothetical protein [Dyella caseinilytica]QRN53905.1 hypothetical protein ISN74_00335 [Dyella caseinilytica]GFZ90029.1 hypothetical protein GCM10011408_06390 [Dyella caseinilytica]